MKTWTNYPSGNSATTTWYYHDYRGWLTNKSYGDDLGPIYTYTDAGRLASRTWGRGVTTWYTNNDAGELWVVNYSDSTPDVTYGHDRRGRQTSITRGSTTTTRTYNDAGQWLTESYSGGPLSGLSVTNVYDQFLRRTNLTLNSQPSTLDHRYTYDAASRLDTVTDVTLGTPHSAQYTYVANSPLVDNIVFKQSGTTRMTTTKQHDVLNRLTSITNEPSGASAIGYRYVYNDANQRTTVTNADTSRWVYSYDDLGQVISGKKYWSDGTPVAGQQFEYEFDDIGNRRTNGFGGDASGVNLRSAAYVVNNLNQYTSRTAPGYVNVLGEATNTASISVNTNMAYRKDRYFRAELTVDNAANAVWLGVTNVAVMPSGAGAYVVSNVTGHVLWPKTPEMFTYDADGNLTSDSLWTNQWNAENRRIVIESRDNVPTAARRREQWTHLPDGRWIERIVSTNNGTAYYPAFTNRYVWDGQVLLAVLDHGNNLVVSFTRGLDLSGTLQGAGGVGGLLAVSFPNEGTHFAAYDGNGNVTALVSATDGSESARYEYGPFAEPIRMTGPAAKLNPIRFSTQYADDVTGDVKYLFRDYDSDSGRWPSRDSIAADLRTVDSLYAFLGNAPIDHVDWLGLCSSSATGGSQTCPSAPQACQGSLVFTMSLTTLSSAKEAKKRCKGSPACSQHRFKAKLTCKKCGGCSWRIAVDVTARCDIYYLDPQIVTTFQYQPSPAHVITHENCHCHDALAAYQKLIGNIGNTSYTSKTQCQRAKMHIHFRALFDREIEPSDGHHDDSMWGMGPMGIGHPLNPSAPCFAYWTGTL